MNKFYLTLLLSFVLVPALPAQEPDIIYVDGKPVYIKGLEPANTTTEKTREEMIKEEAARSNIPGDIYRGTVLGSQTPTNTGETFGSKKPTYRGNVLGERVPAIEGQEVQGTIYRGTVFGENKQGYASDTPGTRELAKTKYVYDTSLVRAIKTGDADRVRTLIYANVDVNERNYAGITPLTVAAEKGNMDIIKLLVEEGSASVNLNSSYGVTPLIAAAAAGQREAVDYLLQNGADPTAKDDLGKTALLHAM
ncbi:MAG TPA: ankyrin repeat domain-containing protein, partial [Candidatus Avelusimicrobium excrementipullorum]|nr:ankyrin repeat domain-containing protein [Candidatus Avelusimicrobium excrementipullorum]